jgi:hypothetical protein
MMFAPPDGMNQDLEPTGLLDVKLLGGLALSPPTSRVGEIPAEELLRASVDATSNILGPVEKLRAWPMKRNRANESADDVFELFAASAYVFFNSSWYELVEGSLAGIVVKSYLVSKLVKPVEDHPRISLLGVVEG